MEWNCFSCQATQRPPHGLRRNKKRIWLQIAKNKTTFFAKYGNVTYVYDKFNRLVRENNPTLDKTTTWCYDVSGNVCSRTEYAYTTGTVGTPVATFNYTYEKDKLLQLNTNFGGDPATLTFIYDSQGVKGFAYNNRVYHYVKNLFGDVTDIYCGATKVAEYAYDAWGNCTIVSATTALALSVI